MKRLAQILALSCLTVVALAQGFHQTPAYRGAAGKVAATGGGSPSTLNTGIIAYWNLNEVIGTRADSVGGNTLTDNNSTGSTAGKIGNGGNFVNASHNYLSHASNAALSLGGPTDWTITFWMNATTIQGNAGIICKRVNGCDSNDDYYIAFDGAGTHIAMAVNECGQAEGPAVSTGVWYFVCVRYTASNKTSYLSVNNGTESSNAWSATQTAGTGEFRIGGLSDQNSNYTFDGVIDEVGFWKRSLTPSEIAEDYNVGAGKTYPF